MPNVVGLFGGLRDLRPGHRALALAPKTVQGLEGRLTVAFLFRQKATDDEPGAANSGSDMKKMPSGMKM